MKTNPVKKAAAKVSRKTSAPGMDKKVFRLGNILVPVDFSDCSDKAVEYAVSFARQFGARILLLHVVQPYIPAPEMTNIDTDVLNSGAREGAEKELAKLAKSLDPALAVETELRFGNPHVEIVQAAKEDNADLIIIPTHGRSGLAHLFLGGTAERVVRHAGCPVLVVRENEHEFIAAE